MVNKNPYLRQDLRIAPIQKLALTPALLQKIELLKLSHLELSEFVKSELLQNPVLEEDGNSRSPEMSSQSEPAAEHSENISEPSQESKFEDIDYNAFFEDYLDTAPRGRGTYEDYEKPEFETFAVKPVSLSEHLFWQLGLTDLSPAVETAAREIIGNLNPDGYLEEDLSEILSQAGETAAEMDGDLEITASDVEEALTAVQQFDPTGIGARDLRECLMIQLEYWGLKNTPDYRMLRDYAEMLERKEFEKIAEIEDCSPDDVREVLERIRHLNPKPGQQYQADTTIYIQPDVYIYKMGHDYIISLNEDGLPRLHLSSYYKQVLKSSKAQREEKKYIREKFRNAVELIRNLDHRKRTIYRVCEIIVKQQREFLEKGLGHLKPMLLKDVAEQLGLHTSTISRAVTNKWVHCPQGIIELRKFFTLGFKTDGGEDISIYILKNKIRDLIKNEDTSKPLSDSHLTEILNREGIDIKRRTIAKYREELDIPNSRERRIKI